MHRRGHRGELGSLSEERFLDGVILEKTAELGRAATMGFADPDFVIDIETVDDRSGLSLWSREERVRFPFLGID
jgi:tRNA(Ser,Leu) C12 N-acetylase TAN1